MGKRTTRRFRVHVKICFPLLNSSNYPWGSNAFWRSSFSQGPPPPNQSSLLLRPTYLDLDAFVEVDVVLPAVLGLVAVGEAGIKLHRLDVSGADLVGTLVESGRRHGCCFEDGGN